MVIFAGLVMFFPHIPDSSFWVQTLIAVGYMVFIGVYLRRSIFTRRKVPGKLRLWALYLFSIAIFVSYLVWSYLHPMP